MRISGSARSPRTPTVSSTPATNSSTMTRSSCSAAARYAIASSSWSTLATLLMPIVEPSRAGLTISGSPSSATIAHQSEAASTTR
jgi:hypothetical protein